MSIDKEGYFSTEVEAAAHDPAQFPEWRALTRDLNRTVQRLFAETGVPAADHLTPAMISRMLLGRALSNFQGAILLSERGMAVEARTLARTCLETAFCLTAVLQHGEKFIDRLVADAQKHRRELARNVIKVSPDGELGVDLEEALHALLASISEEGAAQWLHTSQMAELSPLHGMFLFYRELSGDAAHPTIGALERYFVDGDAQRFQWGPDFAADTVVSTRFYACTFLIAAAASFTADVAESEPFAEEISVHWQRLQELAATAKVFAVDGE